MIGHQIRWKHVWWNNTFLGWLLDESPLYSRCSSMCRYCHLETNCYRSNWLSFHSCWFTLAKSPGLNSCRCFINLCSIYYELEVTPMLPQGRWDPDDDEMIFKWLIERKFRKENISKYSIIGIMVIWLVLSRTYANLRVLDFMLPIVKNGTAKKKNKKDAIQTYVWPSSTLNHNLDSLLGITAGLKQLRANGDAVC